MSFKEWGLVALFVLLSVFNYVCGYSSGYADGKDMGYERGHFDGRMLEMKINGIKTTENFDEK